MLIKLLSVTIYYIKNGDNMKKIVTLTVLLLSMFVLSGCSGAIKNMKLAPVGAVIEKPSEGKAQVVFLRPQSAAYAIQSSVFEIKDEKPEIAGVIPAKAKFVYEVDAGEHLFMVLGESGDFMSANLEAGKTYYALVRPRMGLWKARFSFDPVHKDEQMDGDLEDWLSDCRLVEASEATDRWAQENAEDIEEEYMEYYQNWMEKYAEDRPRLFPEDGI